MAPIIIVAGVSVTITKAYRPQLWIGWSVVVICLGVLTITQADTALSQVMGVSTLLGIGAGIIYGQFYPVHCYIKLIESTWISYNILSSVISYPGYGERICTRVLLVLPLARWGKLLLPLFFLPLPLTIGLMHVGMAHLNRCSHPAK